MNIYIYQVTKEHIMSMDPSSIFYVSDVELVDPFIAEKISCWFQMDQNRYTAYLYLENNLEYEEPYHWAISLVEINNPEFINMWNHVIGEPIRYDDILDYTHDECFSVMMETFVQLHMQTG